MKSIELMGTAWKAAAFASMLEMGMELMGMLDIGIDEIGIELMGIEEIGIELIGEPASPAGSPL